MKNDLNKNIIVQLVTNHTKSDNFLCVLHRIQPLFHVRASTQRDFKCKKNKHQIISNANQMMNAFLLHHKNEINSNRAECEHSKIDPITFFCY